MSKISSRAAFRLAVKNAAGLIAAMDLEQLYGDVAEDDLDTLEEAQWKLVAFLKRKSGEVVDAQ